MEKNKQKTLFEMKEVWQEEWEDMPEYSQEYQGAHRTIYLHFRNQTDVDEFSKLINQKIYPKYKSYWFPKMEVKEVKNIRYVDKPATEIKKIIIDEELKPIYIESKFTGGHYALKTKKATKAFENPMGVNKSIEIKPTDIIADIGGYIGEYSIWASKIAKKVYTYEPTPNTFKILKKNKKKNMEIYNYAVVGDDKKTVNLYISQGIGATNSITKTIRKKGNIEVNAIKYEAAIKDATVVKIDVEGAEYEYNIIQPQIRAIILEFHPIPGKPWQEWARNIMTDLEKNGFKPIAKKPEFKHGWDLTGSWAR